MEPLQVFLHPTQKEQENQQEQLNSVTLKMHCICTNEWIHITTISSASDQKVEFVPFLEKRES
jgi:hypothetical protein